MLESLTSRTIGEREPRRSLRERLWNARQCYVLMAPGAVLIAMFSFYPLLITCYYSLFDWSGIGQSKYFIGLQNFSELMHDAFFWRAFWRSTWFTLVATPIELILSLLLAILLNDRALKLGRVFRTMLFIPVVTTTAIASIMMSFVFAAFNGPVNQVLQGSHVTDAPVDFLGNPHSVMWTAIGIFVWKWLGQPMIFWLAGLQTIPEEVYEAARLDGAGWWRQAVSITAPQLAPFAVIITVIVTVGNLQMFAFMQALTNGGPFFSSETMELYIYRMAFGAGTSVATPRLGYASAAGLVFGALVVLLGAVHMVIVRRRRTGRSAAGQVGA